MRRVHDAGDDLGIEARPPAKPVRAEMPVLIFLVLDRMRAPGGGIPV